MKIAILTLALDANYGGILQCYALQTVLESFGHDVKVLTKPKYGRSYCIIYSLAVCKRLIKRYVLRDKISIFKAYHEIIRTNIDCFIRQYIHQYKLRKWTEDIANRFDAIIVGSDQVWRPIYSQDIPIEQYYLSFLRDSNIKRISYAASFGVDYCEYSESQIEKCMLLLRKFNAVSVRESSGISLCRKLFEVNAELVLDPTLLLQADDYRSLIKKGNTQPSKGNLFVYVLDRTEEKENLVRKIASKTGLIPYWEDANIRDESIPSDKRIKISIEQWLRSFDDADFIITDSFHGCVFSIIFQRQFIVIGNKGRGMTRFDSLLALFSLTDRLFFLDGTGFDNTLLEKKIDYKSIFEEIEKQRIHSLDFIKRSLSS